MTDLQKKLRAAVAQSECLTQAAAEFESKGYEGVFEYQAVINGARLENARLAPILATLEGCVEALEMGAFHHPICPYYDSKPCLCAHKKVNAALETLRKALEEKP